MSAVGSRPEGFWPVLSGYLMRPARAEDLDAIMVVEESAYESGWPRSVFERELVQEWSHVDLVCPSGSDEPVAHIVYWIVHDELHLLNVAVHRSARRRGLGRAMIERLLKVCEAECLQYITLEVRVSNEAAIRLYQAHGFRRIGRRRRYYANNGEDALVMALVLQGDEQGGEVAVEGDAGAELSSQSSSSGRG